MAAQVTKRAGGLLLHRFTFTAEAEVCFLLHYPLGFPSHPLDGTLSYRSSDFPLLRGAKATAYRARTKL
jgi:hypothetical protein